MAKTVAPLLSWSASGQIAKTQVYSTWKGRPYVRRYVIPANPNTAGQQLTRNTFAWLNDAWKFFPAGALGAWALYAASNRYTSRNGFLSQNVGPLRTQTDLLLMTLSTAAGSGLVAANLVLTPAPTQITVDLTAPVLPAGWTITQAWALAIRDVDPQTSEIFDIGSGNDVSTPYSIIITGLTNAVQYVVGGWFEFLKANGDTAYGVSLQGVSTPA